MIFKNESFSIFSTVIKNDRWSSNHVDHSLDEIFRFGHSNRFLVMLTTEMTMKMVDSFSDQCGLGSIIWSLKKKFLTIFGCDECSHSKNYRRQKDSEIIL